jgi:hypothetical protein
VIKNQRRMMKMIENGTARRKGVQERMLRLAQAIAPSLQSVVAPMVQGLGNYQAPGLSGPPSTPPVTASGSSGSGSFYVNAPTTPNLNIVGAAVHIDYSPAEMMRLLKAFTSTRFPRKTMPDGTIRDQHPEFIALPFPPGKLEEQDPTTGDWSDAHNGIAYVLPDGSELVPDGKGGCQQVASDGTVTYRPCYIRNFNRFLNASDLVDEFIRALGTAGMKQDQVLKVPLGPFIHWLIGKAAEADGDPVPADIPPVSNHPALAPFRLAPKCKLCGKFLPRRLAAGGMFFCNGRHMDRYVREQGIGA